MILSSLQVLKAVTWVLPDSEVTVQRSISTGRKDQFPGAIYPHFLAALSGPVICVHDRFISALDHSIRL